MYRRMCSGYTPENSTQHFQHLSYPLEGYTYLFEATKQEKIQFLPCLSIFASSNCGRDFPHSRANSAQKKQGALALFRGWLGRQ